MCIYFVIIKNSSNAADKTSEKYLQITVGRYVYPIEVWVAKKSDLAQNVARLLLIHAFSGGSRIPCSRYPRSAFFPLWYSTLLNKQKPMSMYNSEQFYTFASGFMNDFVQVLFGKILFSGMTFWLSFCVKIFMNSLVPVILLVTGILVLSKQIIV